MSSSELFAAILGFSLLVVIHELGHLIFARIAGMKILKFSIGFGPALVKVTHRETTYQLALIPVGGYVQIAGQVGEKDYSEGSFLTKSLLQRGLVVAAGPIFNFILAGGIYTALFASFNALSFEWERVPTTTVREVEGPAAAAGMQAWDRIVRIDGKDIRSFNDIRRAVGLSDGNPMKVKVSRSASGQPQAYARKNADRIAPGLRIAMPSLADDAGSVNLTVQPEKTRRGWRMGISPDLARFGAEGMGTSLKFAASETWTVIGTTVGYVGKALQGDDDVQVASVVKITKVGADTVRRGWEWFFNLLALLSINLGFLNLLPLPGLDGGRLVFIFYEAIAGKPAPARAEMLIHGVGMILLLGLIMVITARDIIDLF